MNLSADMREVWKRLARSGAVMNGYAQDGTLASSQVFAKFLTPKSEDWGWVHIGSAMQGCKL